MRRIAVATIVAKPMLAHARVLAESFLRYHPDLPFFVLLADDIQGCFDPARETFLTLLLDDLSLPDAARLKFRYTSQELSYALTPSLLTALLDRGFDSAIFLKQESLATGPF